MKILVTGASGFIGSNLCPALVARGIELHAVSRRSTPQLKALTGTDGYAASVSIVADLVSEPRLEQLCEGADVVVHAAGIAHRPNTTDAEYAHNTALTGTLARAAARAGVRRFVHLSSAKVYGGTKASDPYRENAVLTPDHAYGRNKLEAEQVLLDLSVTTSMRPLILRIPLVYGAGVKGNFLRLLQVATGGMPIPLGLVDNRRSLLYVGNLIDALITFFDHDRPIPPVLNVADRLPVSTAEVVREIARNFGVNPRLVPIPNSMLWIGASLIGRRADYERLCGDLVLDCSEFGRALDWNAPYSLADGIAATASWFREGQRADNNTSLNPSQHDRLRAHESAGESVSR
jgi:nucleoside-diphosphate-sugar epimerase